MSKCKHEWTDIDSVYDDLGDVKVVWTVCKHCKCGGMIKVTEEDVEWEESDE